MLLKKKKRNKHNNFKNLLNNNLFVILIACLLLWVWWIFALIFSSQTNFLVLKKSYPIAEYKSEQMLKDKIVRGEFKAWENNLGIVYLNIDRYIKPEFRLEDQLEFRLKEKNSNKWLYEQKIRSGLFENFSSFPFGFPIISNSKGKTFIFELKSLRGDPNNAIRISSTDPLIITSYHFSPENLATDYSNVLNYLYKKTISSVIDTNFILSSILFALPLIIFIFAVLWIRKSKLLEKPFLILICLLIITDILFISSHFLGLFIALSLGWILCTISNRFNSGISFLIALGLIIFWSVSTFIGYDKFTNKLNIWTFFFFALGIVQLCLEEKFNIKNLKDYKSLTKIEK